MKYVNDEHNFYIGILMFYNTNTCYEKKENKIAKITSIADRLQFIEVYGRALTARLHNLNILSPIIHGDQIAIEIYLRAMVKQFDDTQCYSSKCDWAMHNNLIYYGLLQNIPGIKSIKQVRSSQGAVNMLGRIAPLQDKPVWMKDGTIWNTVNLKSKTDPSWAVHQYDKDEMLNKMIKKKAKRMVSKLNETYASHRTPLQMPNRGPSISNEAVNTAALIQPTWGEHRPGSNAIFAIMNECKLEAFALLVKGALKVGFKGDIVMSVASREEMSTGVLDFLQHYHKMYTSSGAKTINLVVYEGAMKYSGDYSLVSLTALHSNFTDIRPSRTIDVARLEVSLSSNI